MKRFFQILVLLIAVSISSAFAQKTYKVGDYYNDGTKEGVVFWVDETGTQGKIVSLDEAYLGGCDNEQNTKNLGTLNQEDGRVNTDRLMSRTDRNQYPALVWCRNKGKDWYLPAIREMEAILMENVNNVINKTLSSRGAKVIPNKNALRVFWTSSGVYLDSKLWVGSIAVVDKSEIMTNDEPYNSNGFVRAVARFDTRTATNVSTPKTYKVGDYYNDGTKEGVVFWVDATGQHGKIVSMDQMESEWCTREQFNKGIITGATSKTDGKTNTDKIMTRADKKQYPAFIWCRNLGEDWYLPAIEELTLLVNDHNVRYAIDKTLKKRGGTSLVVPDVTTVNTYLSSTEGDGTDARYFVWYYFMYEIYATMSQKNQSGTISRDYVRAIATF